MKNKKTLIKNKNLHFYFQSHFCTWSNFRTLKRQRANCLWSESCPDYIRIVHRSGEYVISDYENIGEDAEKQGRKRKRRSQIFELIELSLKFREKLNKLKLVRKIFEDQ